MHELDDNSLLRQYAEQNSEAAFAALVTRHVDKVYSVALRHTRNGHAAEEITQAGFVILAKKSGRRGAKVVLSGWLYETARLTALPYIRSEIRRARREQEAHMESALNENNEDVWPHIAPLLDDALAKLNETDRHAIVLRYLADFRRASRFIRQVRGWLEFLRLTASQMASVTATDCGWSSFPAESLSSRCGITHTERNDP